MSFVDADLGASGTRYVTEAGKINHLPNNYVFLDNNEMTRLDPNDEEIENNLEFTVTKTSGSELDYFPCTAVMGRMAERYSSTNTRPSVMTHKHMQKINYISAVMAVAVSKIKFSIEDNVTLVLAVPPIEITPAREAFRRLVGEYSVTFPKYMGGTTVKFNIEDVECYEESVMAIASFFFNMNGTPREENKDLMVGNILSLDIGASTSDIAIIRNGKYIDMSGRTYKTGGNVARSSFIDAVKSQEGYELPIDAAEVAIADGRIQQGNSYKDVGGLVTRAKKRLASKLMSDMQTYFSETDTPVQTIRAVIVSGGGSMQGQYVNADGELVKTSEPMSKFVTDELKQICSGVEAIPYGEDARLANIKGLFIRTKVAMAKKARAVQAQMAATQAMQATAAQAVHAATVQTMQAGAVQTGTVQGQTAV